MAEKDSTQESKGYRWPQDSSKQKIVPTSEISNGPPTIFKEKIVPIVDFSDGKILNPSNTQLGESQILDSSYVFDQIATGDQLVLNESNLEIDCQMYFGRTGSKRDMITYLDDNLENSGYNRDGLYLGFESLDNELEADFPILPFSEKSNYKMGDNRDFMDLEGYLGGNEDTKRRNSSNSLIGGY